MDLDDQPIVTVPAKSVRAGDILVEADGRTATVISSEPSEAVRGYRDLHTVARRVITAPGATVEIIRGS